MSELSELEMRLAAALHRIGAGIEGLSAVSDQPEPTNADAGESPEDLKAEITRLNGLVEDERLANAQLEERVKALKERQDGKVQELETAVENGRGRSARMDRELQRLRQVNAELRDINSQLREAVASGVSEAHLVNKAMLAELDALRATQKADAAEMDAILEELTPIIEREAADAAG